MTWGNVARKYGPYMFDEETLDKNFTYHPPKEDQRSVGEIRANPGHGKIVCEFNLSHVPIFRRAIHGLNKAG